MKERQILFSGPMVRAILDGRKTQTRRVVKPQPKATSVSWGCLGGKGFGFIAGDEVIRCPFGQPGDCLWVRENWAALDADYNIVPRPDDLRGGPWPHVSYAVDHSDPKGDGPANPVKWRASIHMPRWACRILLEVTGVRVERLQAISEDDALAEGFKSYDIRTWANNALEFERYWYYLATPGTTWADNPWVWVIEFKRVTS